MLVHLCVFACMRECAVIPGIGTVCDSEIMVLCRACVCACVCVCMSILLTCVCLCVKETEWMVHKCYLPKTTVALFNQYPSTNTHTPLLPKHPWELPAFIK